MNEIKYIPVTELFPHPDNPRKDVGDITELADSIKENGILQNLTVVPSIGGYTVIIGHRRLAAAKKAGLERVPCAVREMSPSEQVKTMLLENMQRSDLTVYEQAQGFQLMLDFGETVETIAKESGFSESTVRRRVKLLSLDAEKFKASEARGATLQDYMELDKLEDPELKNRALDAIGTPNFKNVLKSAIEEELDKKLVENIAADVSKWAAEITAADREKYEYRRNYGRWNTKKDFVIKPPEDADTVNYYYIVGKQQVEIYSDKAEKAETAEDLQQKEQQAAHDRKVRELSGITKRHYSLRLSSIYELAFAKKHTEAICRFAAKALLERGKGSYTWHRPLDHAVLGILFDLDLDEDTADTERERWYLDESDRPVPYALMAIVYAMTDHERNGYWEEFWSGEERKYCLCYSPNDELDELYDFLISLGYEMSDEEKAMQSGTHPLFEREEGR